MIFTEEQIAEYGIGGRQLYYATLDNDLGKRWRQQFLAEFDRKKKVAVESAPSLPQIRKLPMARGLKPGGKPCNCGKARKVS